MDRFNIFGAYVKERSLVSFCDPLDECRDKRAGVSMAPTVGTCADTPDLSISRESEFLPGHSHKVTRFSNSEI